MSSLDVTPWPAHPPPDACNTWRGLSHGTLQARLDRNNVNSPKEQPRQSGAAELLNNNSIIACRLKGTRAGVATLWFFALSAH
jgi:hypothetical protein